MRMQRDRKIVLVAVVAIVISGLGIALVYIPNGGAVSSSSTSMAVTRSDTFLTSCSVTGIGGFELRVVSDITGAPVSGETISAVDRLGCNSETQVVYLDNFSETQGGWMTPVFPSQAEAGGGLNFTVTYQAGTYTFTSSVPPVGTECVTLHVPSGNVTTMNVMTSC
jgi:hypothetical protein